MDHNMLEGWLALAAETRRVDRLSSSLGLDSPAFQKSPSSMGSSRGSSGLNTPSQNAFRFLPFLNDVSPELLKSSAFDFGRPSQPLSKQPSPQSQPLRNGNPSQIQTRRQAGRSRASTDTVDSPSQSDWKSPRISRAHPYPYHPSHISQTPSMHVQRPSLHSNRHTSYPTWPAPNSEPLSTEFNVNASTSSSIYGAPISPPGRSRDTSSRYADGHNAPGFEIGNAITDPISPMLSEPFHRLIVKDEDELVDLSGVPVSPRMNDEEINTVPDEDEECSNTWWHDDSREMPFDFEVASEYQNTGMLNEPLDRLWIPPKRSFNVG